MGRPSLPIEVLKARGSWRATINKERASELVAMLPPKPSWLIIDLLASTFYDDTGAMLLGCKLVTEIDGMQLASFAAAYATYVRCHAIVCQGDRGFLDVNSAGNYVVHPAYKVMDSALDKIMKFTREFGMSPSARARVITYKEPGDSKHKPGDVIESEQPKDKNRFFTAAS